MIRTYLAAAVFSTATAVAVAQDFSSMTDIDPPVGAEAIPLQTGPVANGALQENWFTFGDERAVVRNVTAATLTPVLPADGTGNGAAVIVAPGGAFMMLSMDLEAWPVAEWLADHGIAAFVLKYRLTPTPADNGEFAQSINDLLASVGSNDTAPAATEDAIADGQAALALVRSRADEWGLDGDRIGLLGFSAGAMTVLGTTLEAKPDEMPAFVAPIYGSLAAVDVPSNAPPLFVALAADDPLMGARGFGLVESWQSAGKPVELHLYQNGGHGFGLGAEGTAAAGWIEDFHHWLEVNGLLEATR